MFYGPVSFILGILMSPLFSLITVRDEEIHSPAHLRLSRNNNDNDFERHLRFFFAISSLCCELSPVLSYTQWPLRNHLQITTYLVFLVCHMLCAMWYEGTAQLFSLTVEIKFTLALFSG